MCDSIMVKQNAVNQLNKVDRTLAERVAKNAFLATRSANVRSTLFNWLTAFCLTIIESHIPISNENPSTV